MTGMFFNYNLPGVGPDESYLMSGDSGGPSFAVVDGQLTLLGEHFSTWGTCGQPGAPGNVPPTIVNGVLTGGDPNASNPANESGAWWSVDGFVPSYVSQIDAQMAGSGESVATVVPEPSSAMLLLAGLLAVAAVAWRKRERKAALALVSPSARAKFIRHKSR